MEDKRPARRKDKSNPYTLSTKNGKNFVTFRDSRNITVTLEIDKPIFELFNTFELEDLVYLNQFDRHEEHSELSEQTLERRVCDVEESADDIVMEKIEHEALREAMEHLPETLRRRIVLFYFEGLTYEQIAKREKCSHQAVHKSIHQALEKLKKEMN